MKNNNANQPMSLKKASLINAFFKYSTIILQIGLTAVLARILSPEDYGIVAVVSVFTTFFNVFSDMGLGVGIIQDKSLDSNDISNIYSINIYIGLFLGLAFALCSFPISWFYGDDIYIPICLMLSASVIANTWTAVPRAVLMKNKRFVFVGLQGFIVAIASSVLAIICALLEMKYYALVIQTIFSGVFTFLCLILSTRIKFVFKPHFSSVKKILKFSGYQFAFSFVNYFSRNLDNLLTGKFMGSAQLGFYEKAYKLTLYPVQNLTHVITPVLHPILSDYQNDKKIIYDKYMQVINLLSLIGVYLTVICFFNAEEIILILFGEQWIESIACFKWLSLTIWIQMITGTVGSIYQSLNNTKLQFQTSIITTIIICSFTFIGVLSKNIEVLSIFIAVAYILWGSVWFYSLIKHCFKLKMISFFAQLKHYFYAIILLFFCGFIIDKFIIISNVFIFLFVKIIILSIIYFIILILTKKINVILHFLKRGNK